MMCSLLDDDDILYFRRHLYEITDKIGVEATCFILDMWDRKITVIYKRLRSLLKLSKKYGMYRFEKAAERANYYHQQKIEVIRIILESSLDYLSLSPHTDIWGQQKLNFE